MPKKTNKNQDTEKNELDKNVEAIMGVPPDELPAEIGRVDEKKEKADGLPLVTDKSAPNVVNKEIPEEIDAVDDTKTAEAVDDIAREESDTVLASEDAEVAKAFEPEKKGFKQHLKRLIKKWWETP